MSLKTETQEQIAVLQARLANINRVPTDNFNLGTIVVFSANQNTLHWYYVKTAEERWARLGLQLTPNDPMEDDLASWIINALESTIGYFEVYVLTVGNSPVFTSS